MDREDLLLQFETRRHFFSRCGVGLGKMALLSLLKDQDLFAEPAPADSMRAKPGHFPAKAKSVIYLFMAGGPSQLELYDYKPELQKYNDQPVPDSHDGGQALRLHGLLRQGDAEAAGHQPRLQAARQQRRLGIGPAAPHCRRRRRHHVSEGRLHRELQSRAGEVFVNTGSTRFGRPSMGSWITYGIGSESADLPGFVVLQSGPRGPRGGAALWASGFLPTAYQGVPFRSGGDPILDLSRPAGVSPEAQLETIEAIRDLNLSEMSQSGDPEIATRIASYEMAYRMQTSGPELIDFGEGIQRDAGDVRRRAGQGQLREQLPAGAAAGGARRPLRPALSHRLGPSRGPRPAARSGRLAKSTSPPPR